MNRQTRGSSSIAARVQAGWRAQRAVRSPPPKLPTTPGSACSRAGPLSATEPCSGDDTSSPLHHPQGLQAACALLAAKLVPVGLARVDRDLDAPVLLHSHFAVVVGDRLAFPAARSVHTRTRHALAGEVRGRGARAALRQVGV